MSKLKNAISGINDGTTAIAKDAIGVVGVLGSAVTAFGKIGSNLVLSITEAGSRKALNVAEHKPITVAGEAMLDLADNTNTQINSRVLGHCNPTDSIPDVEDSIPEPHAENT